MIQLSKELPYKLPTNQIEALRVLANVLGIAEHKLQGDNNKIAASMTGTILYRNLDRQDRYSVMEMINSLGFGQLKSELIAKCLDAIVKTQWAEWSMTNEELQSAVNFHNDINRISSVIGGNPGAYGVGGAAWSIIKQGASSGNIAVFAASIALIGIHEFSYSETQKYSAELERRKTIEGVK